MRLPEVKEGWSYTGAVAIVAPTQVGYPVDVENLAKGAHFEDMTFTAADASMTTGGSSSIAAMVNGSTGVSFTRVTFRAGLALAGSVGTVPQSNACAGSLAGGNGNNATPGVGATCTCPLIVGDSSM